MFVIDFLQSFIGAQMDIEVLLRIQFIIAVSPFIHG
jgi:hypothetical protein